MKRIIPFLLCMLLVITPVCAKDDTFLQGAAKRPDLLSFPSSYIPPDLMPYITWAPSALEGAYDADERAYVLTATNESIDPMISVDLSEFTSINADEYKL